ncbi:hypothetical protein DAEQUDRAFT_813834 [Daedalea quercina L-15889]|uniref:Ubiquitin-like protease family profile domain-containing protein n=1 Tax=Daedalea quercina L-15889 TaxID=1314783 RepID=A0A165MQ69_9APHY|nr:hypothetical protein DAEQUDRAFT_813834 [Daedalea quercina L-15889]
MLAFEGAPDTSELATFLSHDWLASEHINMFIEMLRTEIQLDENLRDRHAVWGTYWTQTLWGKYHSAVEAAANQNISVPPSHDVLPTWLLEDGRHLSVGELHSIGLIFNLNDNHWVAVVINYNSKLLLYADSLGYIIPKGLQQLLEWWLEPYGGKHLTFASLPCARQGPLDTFSCGICAPNAIAHYYLPSRYPLVLVTPESVDISRLDALHCIWEYSQHTIEPRMFATIDDSELLLRELKASDTTGPTKRRRTTSKSWPKKALGGNQLISGPTDEQPKPSARKRICIEGTAQGQVEGQRDNGEESDDEEIEEFYGRILMGKAYDKMRKEHPAKRGRKSRTQKCKTSDKAKRHFTPNPKDVLSEVGSTTEDGSGEDLDIYVHPASKLGRPRKPLLDQLTRPLPPVNGKKHYRCAGDRCAWTWAGRTSGRVLAHASRCMFLSSKLRLAASKASKENAPTAKLVAASEVLVDKASLAQASADTGSLLSRGTNMSTSTEASCGTQFDTQNILASGQTTLDVIVGQSGRTKLKLELDPVIVKFICCNGIPPKVVDCEYWKQIFTVPKTRYTPVSRSTLEETQIPQEAEYVRDEQLKFLRTQSNLTLTYDGGANKRHQSYYTAHVSTPLPTRRIFLVDVVAGSRVRHTADWLARRLIKQVIDRIGRGHFGAASSDSTGNTKACRRMLCATIPTMMDLPDPVHHTNLPLKNICKLDFFKELISNIRRTLQFFSKSDQSSEELNDIRDRLSISRGLEKIGKTRFANIVRAAVAMRRSLPALREGCTGGPIIVEETNDCFVRDSPSTLAFETSLNQLLSVTLPYAKTIVCLESTQSTVADVFLYWCGIGASIKQVLTKKATGIPNHVKCELRAIFNSRWAEMFEDGPTDAHLSAVYLDPMYMNSDLFKPELKPPKSSNQGQGKDTMHPAGSDADAQAHIKFPHIFKRVGTYLTALLRNEVLRGEHKTLCVPVGKQSAIKKRFEEQLTAYARNDPPFCMVDRSDYETALEWWMVLEAKRGSDVLAILAIKLFSVMPNSMPDERTASLFTRLNSPVRNKMSLQTMVSQAQIHQFFHTTKSRAMVPPSSAKRFYEINSTLREDTSLRKDAALPGQVRATEPDDEDIDGDEDDRPTWLDEETEHCGIATTLAIEVYINLDSSILHDLLASDPPDDSSKAGDSKSKANNDSESDGEGDGLEAETGAVVSWTFRCDV